MILMVAQAIVLLLFGYFWTIGEFEVRTKLIFTAIYAATWLLLFVGLGWHLAAQAAFGLVVGAFTFAGGGGR